MGLQVSEKESEFLLHYKAAAQSAMSAKLFLANDGVFIRQPLYYATDLAAAAYCLYSLINPRFQVTIENVDDIKQDLTDKINATLGEL